MLVRRSLSGESSRYTSPWRRRLVVQDERPSFSISIGPFVRDSSHSPICFLLRAISTLLCVTISLHVNFVHDT